MEVEQGETYCIKYEKNLSAPDEPHEWIESIQQKRVNKSLCRRQVIESASI
jgi:hypothetical protein